MCYNPNVIINSLPRVFFPELESASAIKNEEEHKQMIKGSFISDIINGNIFALSFDVMIIHILNFSFFNQSFLLSSTFCNFIVQNFCKCHRLEDISQSSFQLKCQEIPLVYNVYTFNNIPKRG